MCRIARDSAKVADQVPFLARTLTKDEVLRTKDETRSERWSGAVHFVLRPSSFVLIPTLEPDGPATGCNPVEVGSNPTGVSDHPTADPDYIDFGSRKVSGTELRRRVAVQAQLPAGTTSRLITWCQKHRLGKPSLGLAFQGRG